MPSPPVQIFLTTIASQPALRQRQEYVLRVLQVKKVQFTSYDLASDEDAKKLWRRKAPLDKQQLPGILIGGEFPGTIQDFEEAVEFGELDQFLRLNEEWKALEDDKPLLRAVPVGIPGAYAPAQMNPEHISPAPSPIKTKPPLPHADEIDAGDKLEDAGLHGVNVTEDDLLKLVEELGLGEADANDLVKGLSSQKHDSSTAAKEEAVTVAETQPRPLPKDEVPVQEEHKTAESVPKVEEPAINIVEANDAAGAGDLSAEEKVDAGEGKPQSTDAKKDA
ncbi:hypothetical protein C8Q74DRAFT_1239045 [Fomes fomentarius]|nr:hypothetical protein C8Q74DRAFT_1239045 [Fomes fomentarius]